MFQIAVASTLPVPSGILIPLFKVGAAFGRQIGELVASLYPLGIVTGFPIVPGKCVMGRLFIGCYRAVHESFSILISILSSVC